MSDAAPYSFPYSLRLISSRNSNSFLYAEKVTNSEKSSASCGGGKPIDLLRNLLATQSFAPHAAGRRIFTNREK